MIYLDHHATTPCDPRVVEAMIPYFSEHFGNPSGRSHALGKKAYEATELARAEVAALVAGEAREVTFTSGATEALNLAVKGLAEAWPDRPRRLVVSAFEHKAVLDTAKGLSKKGFELAVVAPSPAGFIEPDAVRDAIGDGALLVAVMAAQNEIGTVQPLAEIGRVAHEASAAFVVDAVQALGKIPLDLAALGVDLAALTAHKMYGPKGIGALWVRRRRGEPEIQIAPQIEGGGQERGLRAGTLNVPGIVGFGMAAKIAKDEMAAEGMRLLALRERLRREIQAKLPETFVNGSLEHRLPGNLNISFGYVEGESLLMALKELAVSSGSACTSASLEPSYVLRALGIGEEMAHSSLRFGLGRFNTEEEVDYVVSTIVEKVERLRALSPLWEMFQDGVDLKSIQWEAGAHH